MFELFRRRPSPVTGRRRAAGLVTVAAVAVVLSVSACSPVAASVPVSPLQSRLDLLVADDGFPGALAAVHGADGDVDLTAGVGDLKTGQDVPVDGEIRIASNTKTFTAVVVLQLVEEGLVDLDAPIERYLPGAVRGQGVDGNAISVRQLLQHTSGLPDYDALLLTDYAAVQHRYIEPHQLLEVALSQPALFAPGKGWEYSNTNYVVAGLLVQQVTGRPIGEVITDRIIERLGLEHTYWPLEGEQELRGEHPHGYFAPSADVEYTDVTVQDPSYGWAAGQLVSTPRDLLTFFTALIDGKLLGERALAEMQKTVPAPTSSVSGVESYGLGLQTATLSCGVTAWTHGGDIPGFETRGAVTTDGRGVMIAVTALPTGVEQIKSVEAAVDTAICG